MKVNAGGGHVAKAAHPPKQAQAAPKKAAAAEAPAAPKPTAYAGLSKSGSVGTKLHAVG